MKNLILLILLIPLLACTQTSPIQTLKIQNDTTQFGNNLPAGTFIFNSETKQPFQLKKAASSTDSLSTPYLAVGLLTDTNSITVGGKISVINTGYSVFIGEEAGINDDSTNNYNVSIGYQAGKQNTSGNQNTSIGSKTLHDNTTGSNNTSIGSLSNYSNQSGSGNTSVGDNSLPSNYSGSNNTSIGYQSGYFNTSGSGNVFIGYKAGYWETESNKLHIDNYGSGPPLIWGDFATDSLVINGNLTVTGKVTFTNNTPPDSTTATGTLGQIIYDEDYIYICIQSNQWKRVAISTW